MRSESRLYPLVSIMRNLLKLIDGYNTRFIRMLQIIEYLL